MQATKKTKMQKQDGRFSILDAAARVLKESGQPMNCKQIVEMMLASNLWKTTGKTPAGTLSSALQREITGKAKASRFKKIERGQYNLV